jgi:hypothetical protein
MTDPEVERIKRLAQRLEASYLAGEPTPPYADPALVAAWSALRDIALIAGASTTANSLPHIARIARAELRKFAPYPFCLHPEKCTSGRCMAEIVCND